MCHGISFRSTRCYSSKQPESPALQHTKSGILKTVLKNRLQFRSLFSAASDPQNPDCPSIKAAKSSRNSYFLNPPPPNLHLGLRGLFCLSSRGPCCIGSPLVSTSYTVSDLSRLVSQSTFLSFLLAPLIRTPLMLECQTRLPWIHLSSNLTWLKQGRVSSIGK